MKNAGTSKATTPTDREITMTRVFDAPRRLVFKAWTDPNHVARWWGPHGFTNPVCELDARPGGAIRIHMRGPDGTVYPMTGVYQEVVEPERLVFTSAALDEEGNPLFEVLNTVTFTEQGGKTTLTLQARVGKATAKAARYLAGMEAGWTQTLERCGVHVTRAGEETRSAMKNTGALKVTTPTEREIVLTRVFDAPRRLVFDALTKPELLKRWFGRQHLSLVVCDVI